MHQLGEPRIDVVVGKALAEIDGPELRRTPRHHGEDRGADARQLAVQSHGTEGRRAAAMPGPGGYLCAAISSKLSATQSAM